MDADFAARLGGTIPAEVFDRVWALVKALALRQEVPFTLGVVQSLLAYVLAGDFSSPLAGLDKGLVAKIVPLLQGEVATLDAVGKAAGADLPDTQAALAELRAVAEANGDRIRPLY